MRRLYRGVRVATAWHALASPACQWLVSRHRCASTITTDASTAQYKSSSALQQRCSLCDETFTNWADHSSKTSHKARHAICRAYVVPERHEAIMSQLWDHIQLDFALVDQVNNKKVDRRRMKLSGTIGYLAEQGVLCDSVPTAADEGAPELEVSTRFPILVSAGEAYLTYEILQRLSRLMPKALASDVKVIADFLMHPRQLRTLFEMLHVGSLITNGGGTATIAPNEKVAALLAMLGEMYLYTSRVRKHSIADKVGADELVLNVLANHCCENMVSELVHTTLQRIVDEGTPVWKEFRQTEQSYLFDSSCAVCTSRLSGMPSGPLQQAALTTMSSQADSATKALLAAAGPNSPLSAASSEPPAVCKLSWQDLMRSCSLDMSMTVASKNPTFAALVPKMGSRLKK